MEFLHKPESCINCGKDRFEKDGIEYCVFCGTMLGKVIHKGKEIKESPGDQHGKEIKCRTGYLKENAWM